MKTKISVMIWVMGLFAVLNPVSSWAQVANTVQGHLSLASTYEQKIQFHKEVIIALRNLLEEDGKTVGIFASRSNTPSAKRANKFYTTEINEVRKQMEAYTRLADWHRFRAQELEVFSK